MEVDDLQEWTAPVAEVLLVEQLESEADLDVAFATTTTGCDVT